MDGTVRGTTDDGEELSLGGVEELVDCVQERYRHLDEASATIAGAAALFMAIRDNMLPRPREGELLHRADKVLGFAYLVVPDERIQAWIRNGLNHVRSAVFPVRAQTPEEVLAAAFSAVVSIGGQSQKP